MLGKGGNEERVPYKDIRSSDNLPSPYSSSIKSARRIRYNRIVQNLCRAFGRRVLRGIVSVVASTGPLLTNAIGYSLFLGELGGVSLLWAKGDVIVFI